MQTPPPESPPSAHARVADKPPALQRKIRIALPARQCSAARPFAAGPRTEVEQELVAWARRILSVPLEGTAEDEEARQPVAPSAPSMSSGSCTVKIAAAPSLSRILSRTSPGRFAEPLPKRLRTGASSAFSTYRGVRTTCGHLRAPQMASGGPQGSHGASGHLCAPSRRKECTEPPDNSEPLISECQGIVLGPQTEQGALC